MRMPRVSKMSAVDQEICVPIGTCCVPTGLIDVDDAAPSHNRRLELATDFTFGIARRRRRSASTVVFSTASSRNSAVNGSAFTQRMLSSSKPEGTFIRARSARITLTQLVTIASVIAISSTSSVTRVRLCFMARRIGPRFMGSPFVGGGRYASLRYAGDEKLPHTAYRKPPTLVTALSTASPAAP